MARSQSRSTLLMFGCFLATVGRVICLQGGTLPAGSSLSDIAATDSPAIVIRCSSQQPELERYAAQELARYVDRLFAVSVAIKVKSPLPPTCGCSLDLRQRIRPLRKHSPQTGGRRSAIRESC